MRFLDWLLINETKRAIKESNNNFKKILIEVFKTKGNLEVLSENEENLDETPPELQDPFTGSEDAPEVKRKIITPEEIKRNQANYKLLKTLDKEDPEERKIIIRILVELGYISMPEEGEKLMVTKTQVNSAYKKAIKNISKEEEEKEKTVDPEIKEDILKKLKDEMLKLRFKGMEERLKRIEELKNLDINNSKDADRAYELLSDLGYINTPKTALDSEELEKSYTAAVKENDNQEAPPQISGEIFGKSINQLESDFQKTFAELWRYGLLRMPEGTEYLDKLTKTLSKRTVYPTSKKIENWTWKWLPPRSSQYLQGEELELDAIRGIANRMETQHKTDSYRGRSAEKTYGQKEDDEEDFIATGLSGSLMRHKASEEEPEFAFGKSEAFEKLKSIIDQIKQTNPLEAYSFCVYYGMDCDNMDEFNPLRKTGGGPAVTDQVREKLLNLFKGKPEESSIKTMDNAKINRLIQKGEEIFAKMVCADPVLKNSHYGRLIGCRKTDLGAFVPKIARTSEKTKAKKEMSQDSEADVFKQRRTHSDSEGVCLRCGAKQKANELDINLGRATCKFCGIGKLGPSA
jgi:DNA-directed RNA polymerase specialized sigma24 family protein